MDFARKHLKDLGWQEGDGLGKQRNGLSEALKPRLKFDTAGIGHDPAKEFTHTWWNDAYNKAAKSITITESENVCELVVNPPEKSKTKKLKSSYRNFVAGGTLDGEHFTENKAALADDTVGDGDHVVTVRLSDDQLLAACGGRTAHKGARHGHKMDGKLARIMAQEAELMKGDTGNTENEEVQSVAKKKKKKKGKSVETVRDPIASGTHELEPSYEAHCTAKKIKRKKDKQLEKTDEQTFTDSSKDESEKSVRDDVHGLPVGGRKERHCSLVFQSSNDVFAGPLAKKKKKRKREEAVV